MSREALVVGINCYPLLKDEQTQEPRDLQKSADDAEAIAQMLKNCGIFRVKRLPEAIDPKKGEQVNPNPHPRDLPTVADLENKICELFNPPSNPPKTALFFFSGHGLLKDSGGTQEVYLATSDADGQEDFGVSLNWLFEQVQKSPVQQIVIWLDCCHSGALLDLAKANLQQPNISEKDFCLIAACRDFEAAYEDINSEHGVLAEALLSALSPENHQARWVTDFELIDDLAKKLATTKQTPIFYNVGGEILLTGDREQLKRATLMKEVCPYMGLESFGEKDAQFFYGRTELTNQLLDNIQAGNFLAVVGPSGSGKSSLVKAGLLHQLKLGEEISGISGSNRWPIIMFRPGELGQNPLAILSEKLTGACGDRIKVKQAEDLPRAIATILSQKAARRLVLFIDQFEELFTLCDLATRKQFIDDLLDWLNSGDSQNCLTVVLTLRSDFLIKVNPQDYPGLWEKIEQCRVDVTRMTSEELGEAIVKPAEQVGIEVQRELVNQMKMWFDVSGSGSLPLIQYTLRELWSNRQVNRLSLAEYNQLGGVQKALTKRADRVYEELSAAQQQVAQRIFLKLTQLGEGTEDTRRQIYQNDLVNEYQSIQLIEATVDRLTNARLLVTSEYSATGDTDIFGQETGRAIDVAHEALIRHWPRLQSWLNEKTRKAIRIERKIEAEAKDWLRQGKSPQNLLTGTRLAEAEEYLQNYHELGLLSALGKEYIEQSKRQDRIDRRIRYGLIASFVGIVTVFGGMATYFGFQAEKSAKEATRRAIQAEALVAAKFEPNPVKALTKAIELTGRSQQEFKQTLPIVQSSLWETFPAIRERQQFKGHEDAVNSVAISSDGQTIVSGSWDKTVRLWDREGNQLKELKGHTGAVRTVAISPDGQTIVFGSDDKTVWLWDREGNQLKELKGHTDAVRSVAISADGRTIVSGSLDTTIRVWDIQSKSQLAVLEGHKKAVNSVAISADGQTIVSGSDDGTVRLWDREGKQLKKLKDHKSYVKSVAISADGQTIVSGSDDETERLWNRKGEQLAVFKDHETVARSVAISADGKTIISGGWDNAVRLWNREGKQLRILKGHGNSVNSVAISPDGQTIVSGSWDKTVRLWDRESEAFKKLKSYKSDVISLAISSDGQTIVSGHYDDIVRLRDREGNQLQELRGHKGNVYSVAISSDGQTIVSGSWDKTVRLWDREGNQLQELKGHKDIVYSVAISSDGQTIVSGSWDKTVRLWNREGNQLKELKGHKYAVTSVAISPDGQTIVSGSWDKTVRLWNREGNQLKELKGHKYAVTSVAISPDGQTIVSGSADKTVRLWDREGQQLAVFTGHEGDVISLAISPQDGQTIIVSGSQDKTVRLRDREGNQLGVLKAHKDDVISVAIIQDGQNIISGSKDGTVGLWGGTWQWWLDAGCDKLRLHPVFVEAFIHDGEDREIAREAVKTCEELEVDGKPLNIWSNQEKAELRVRQGLAVARLTGDFDLAKDKFKQAQELDAEFYQSLGYDPEEEAKKLSAE